VADLCRLEGNLPALEPSHAVAFTRKLLEAQPEEADLVIVNLSGRGDKDIESIGDQLKS
jgi:tryptophan synthase beta chain